MLEVGNFRGEDPLRTHEERSHFGLWVIVSSPLILGFNLSDSAAMDRVWPIITNREAIAIDQAWAGLPGTLHKVLNSGDGDGDGDIELWAKPLPGRRVAVLVLNAGDANATVTLDARADVPGAPRAAAFRDVWRHSDVALADGRVTLRLPTHDSLLAVFNETETSLDEMSLAK